MWPFKKTEEKRLPLSEIGQKLIKLLKDGQWEQDYPYIRCGDIKIYFPHCDIATKAICVYLNNDLQDLHIKITNEDKKQIYPLARMIYINLRMNEETRQELQLLDKFSLALKSAPLKKNIFCSEE